MSQINLQVTANTYSDSGGATLTCPPTEAITVIVSNAGAYYQLALDQGVSGIQWEPERFLPPAGYNFGRTDFRMGKARGIRFRSSAIGVPATITASA